MTERENALRAFARKKPEWIPSARKSVEYILPSAIRERNNGGNDWFGAYWEDNMVPGESLLYEDMEELVEKIKFPDVAAMDWDRLAKSDLEKVDRDNKVIFLTILVGPFERLPAMIPFDAALCAFDIYPEETAEYMRRMEQHKLELISLVLKHYSPDVICLNDDYGYVKNLFFSPGTWTKFFKPSLMKFNDLIHKGGALAALHSCGKVETLVPEFISSGVDIWDSVNACNDLSECSRKYGSQITFSPGLDQQGVTAVDGCTIEQAKEETRRTIDQLAGHGGLIIRPEQPRVPQDIIDACFEEIESYGKTYYQLHQIL